MTETYRDELTLSLETSDGKTITQTLKNPRPDIQTTITTINNINQSLAGGLSGIWFADTSDNPEIKSISQVVHLEQMTRKTPIYTNSE